LTHGLRAKPGAGELVRLSLTLEQAEDLVGQMVVALAVTSSVRLSGRVLLRLPTSV
jgi:hypothetical protein